jgi:hypothetical protein
LGAEAAGAKEAMLQGPVLGQVYPDVVLILPAVVPQTTENGAGRDGSQGGHPKWPLIGRKHALGTQAGIGAISHFVTKLRRTNGTEGACSADL